MTRYAYFLILWFIYSCNVANKNKQDVIDLSSNINGLEIFAEGIISTDLYERDIAISKDGTEIIYSLGDYKQSLRCLVSLKKENGDWTKGKILPFSGGHNDIEPFISPSGDKLFFASDRPTSQSDQTNDYNIWYCDKQESRWSTPILMDTIINKEGDEYYPTVGNSGNLYFTSSRENGIGSEDIFCSKLIDGVYQKAYALDTNINTKTYEFNAYINPEETLLIFSSFGRPDGLGGGDLYISRKNSSGNWTPSIHLKAPINSKNLDYCPFIDFENNMFYFTSDRSDTLSNPIADISSFKQFSKRTSNGMGNIYRTSLNNILRE